ncbi:MAG: monovalent cation/H(+) antiporter subunit G [Deltaproteobacteria bacterium]|nr:monovalent cation/H(+) antiporter subunit G [Deltaproteobacteria bacterium]
MLLNLAVVLLLLGGLVFFTGGAVGIVRFPDFYSRLHPAGKLDTSGSFLMLLGLALYTLHEFDLANLLTALKIMLIVVLVFLASPTATHAIVDSGLRAGLAPWTKRDLEMKP